MTKTTYVQLRFDCPHDVLLLNSTSTLYCLHNVHETCDVPNVIPHGVAYLMPLPRQH